MGSVRLAATAALMAFAGATLLTPAWAESHFTKLTGAQIKAKVAGMEITDEVH